MKTKTFGGLFILAIAAVAAFNVSINVQNNQLSPLALANMEALAQESNNAGNGNSSYYTHLLGRPKECTLYLAFDANGNLVYSGEEKKASGGVSWTYTSQKGIKELCPNKGAGCTVYSCRQ